MTAIADVRSGWTLPANSVSFTFAPHAVKQVNRRYLRRLSLERAEHELYRLAAERGKITRQQPKWLHKPPSRAVAWLVVDDPKMAFPLFDGYGDDHGGGLVAGTCLTPGQSPVGATVRWRQ